MATDELPKLNDSELLTLTGTLLRTMRVDRQVTPEECEVVVSILVEVMAAADPAPAPATAYREDASNKQFTDEARAAAVDLIDQAATRFPDDATLRASLMTVQRFDAQRLIYDAVFSLCAVNTVTPSEQGFLDEIRRMWKLPDGAV